MKKCLLGVMVSEGLLHGQLTSLLLDLWQCRNIKLGGAAEEKCSSHGSCEVEKKGKSWRDGGQGQDTTHTYHLDASSS